MQCSQQTGPADIELRGTGETQFGIRPSRILSKWINAVFFYIFSIHNYCRVIKIEKTAEFLLIDDAFSFSNFDKYLPDYAIKYICTVFRLKQLKAIVVNYEQDSKMSNFL